MYCSEEEKWAAVVDCDAKADGKFYYVVKTVGVYCRPSCKSRTPLRKNTLFFDTANQAEQAGFRPCKRCRPDLLNYEPALEIAKKTKDLIDVHFDQKSQLSEEMRELGVSVSQLTRIFRSEYGMAPSEYLSQVRLECCLALLEREDYAIADIAWEIGYGSLGAFYRFFKKQTGTTPKEYRMQKRADVDAKHGDATF